MFRPLPFPDALSAPCLQFNVWALSPFSCLKPIWLCSLLGFSEYLSFSLLCPSALFYRAWCVVTALGSSSEWMEITFQVPCVAHLLLKAFSIFLEGFVGPILGLTLLVILNLFPSKEMWKKITVLLNTIFSRNSCRIPLGIFCKGDRYLGILKENLAGSKSQPSGRIHISKPC